MVLQMIYLYDGTSDYGPYVCVVLLQVAEIHLYGFLVISKTDIEDAVRMIQYCGILLVRTAIS